MLCILFDFGRDFRMVCVDMVFDSGMELRMCVRNVSKYSRFWFVSLWDSFLTLVGVFIFCFDFDFFMVLMLILV